MPRAPDWTEAEFELLLSQPRSTVAELQPRLPQRSVQAISLVRSAMHDFHNYGSCSLLSQMMVRRLEDPKSPWTCPICLAVQGKGG
jgi:hypothetical protein